MKISRAELRLIDRTNFDTHGRPEHQLDRGERFGNQRRQVAELKVRERRNQRAQNQAELRRLKHEGF